MDMENQDKNSNLKEIEHHKQLELCNTRPAYRQGRKLTSVKVYTVNSESQHLFIYGVPKINLRIELKNLCQKYGQIQTLHVVSDYKTEIFTECYHVQYERIQSARIAKRLIDNRSFYGGLLHVCYAPEYESIEETRNKLLQRSRDVASRLTAEGDHQSHRKREVKSDPVIKIKRQRSKKFFEIYSEDDPILKSFRANQPVEQDIGPQATPEQIKAISKNVQVEASDTRQNILVPAQVIKTTPVEKRIVFRKKTM